MPGERSALAGAGTNERKRASDDRQSSSDRRAPLLQHPRAVQVADQALLQRLAERWNSKFDWHFDVRDGAFHQAGVGSAHVFEVAPMTIFGFGRNEGVSFSQTRWRF